MPVEYRTETAGSRGFLRGNGIEQNTIGGGVITLQRRQIGCRFDGKSLHHLQSEFLLDGAQPRRGFPAVQLQYVRLQHLDDVSERRIVGIDREGDLYGTALYMLSKVARGLKTQMSRRRREEHESNHVGAGIQRDVERLGRGQAANFDDQGHGSMHGWGGDRRRKSDALGARSTTSRPACLACWPHISRPATGRKGAAGRPAGASPRPG